MKKLIVILFALFAFNARAQFYAINYETTVAAGGAITSPVFDLSTVGSLHAYLANASGAVARVLVFKCLAKDGTTALFTAADVSVGTSAKGSVTYDPHMSSVAAVTGQTKLPILPCARGQFTVAAAGAAGATLQVLGIPDAPLKIRYETSVAAGAAVQSPIIDTSKVKDISFLVDNSAGAGARNAFYTCFANDGTTAIFTAPNVAVAETAPGNAIITLSKTASAATAATRQTIHPFPPCKKMQFNVAAAGAAAAGLAVYAR